MGWRFSGEKRCLEVVTTAIGGASGVPVTYHCSWFMETVDTGGIVSQVNEAAGNNERQTLFTADYNSGPMVGQMYIGLSSREIDTPTTSTSAQSSGIAYNSGLNEWHLGSAKVENLSSRAAFVNGSGKGIDTNTHNVTVLDKIILGAYYNSTVGPPVVIMSGSVGIACIYDDALSDEQIGSLGKGAWPPYIAQDNLALFTLGFGQGTTERDVVGGLTFSQGVGGTAPEKVGHKNFCPWPGQEWG